MSEFSKKVASDKASAARAFFAAKHAARRQAAYDRFYRYVGEDAALPMLFPDTHEAIIYEALCRNLFNEVYEHSGLFSGPTTEEQVQNVETIKTAACFQLDVERICPDPAEAEKAVERIFYHAQRAALYVEQPAKEPDAGAKGAKPEGRGRRVIKKNPTLAALRGEHSNAMADAFLDEMKAFDHAQAYLRKKHAKLFAKMDEKTGDERPRTEVNIACKRHKLRRADVLAVANADMLEKIQALDVKGSGHAYLHALPVLHSMDCPPEQREAKLAAVRETMKKHGFYHQAITVCLLDYQKEMGKQVALDVLQDKTKLQASEDKNYRQMMQFNTRRQPLKNLLVVMARACDDTKVKEEMLQSVDKQHQLMLGTLAQYLKSISAGRESGRGV